MLCALIPAFPASAAETIQIGDYVQRCTYYGKPIIWRCVDFDGHGPLMLSDKIPTVKASDAGTKRTHPPANTVWIRSDRALPQATDPTVIYARGSIFKRQWTRLSGCAEIRTIKIMLTEYITRITNTLFSSLQFETTALVVLPQVFIAALQNNGGAVGNMICVNNVVPACDPTGTAGREGMLIRGTAIPRANTVSL